MAKKTLTREDFKRVVNAGFNEWLAALPDDDWGDSYKNAVPIRWDEDLGEYVLDEAEQV